MTTQLLSPEAREFTARAILVGQRIDLRAWARRSAWAAGR